MHVEECCSALLNYILPEVDKSKSGLAIDIGVGTFDFYCSLFKKLGFESIAVEPVPNDNLKKICDREKIKLIESCITKTDGTVNIYMGTWQGEENTNLCSTRSDWWGITPESRQVVSMTLPTLLRRETVSSITCMKIDIEGTEIDVISQLLDIPKISLPLVLMFEYGGGGTKVSKQGGWSPDIYGGTLKCLEILKSLDYKEIILIDSSQGFAEQIYDLASLCSFDDIFPETCIYGNIIATRDRILTKLDLHSIAAKYGDSYNAPLYAAPNINIFMRILNKIRRYFSSL